MTPATPAPPQQVPIPQSVPPQPVEGAAALPADVNNQAESTNFPEEKTTNELPTLQPKLIQKNPVAALRRLFTHTRPFASGQALDLRLDVMRRREANFLLDEITKDPTLMPTNPAAFWTWLDVFMKYQ